MSARAPKTNQSQWMVLVDLLLEHPEMVTKSFVGLDARQNYQALWNQAATQLNSMGFGSKTTEKWIEAFTKWKSKVKVKAQNLKLNMNRTGGGGPLPPLLPIEEKLMGIIGWTAVAGDDTSELGFGNIDDQNDTLTITIPDNVPKLTFFKEPQTIAFAAPSLSVLTSAISEKNKVLPSTLNNTTDDLEFDFALPSTSFQATEHNPAVFGNKNKKQKIDNKNKKLTRPNTRPNRNKDDMTLLRMHNESMGVLKEINVNIARIADSQEAFLRKVSICPRCSRATEEDLSE